MTIAIRSGAPVAPLVKGNSLTPCHQAGLFNFRSVSYIQARNFLLADREIPSVTLVGQVFDAFLDAAPVQKVLDVLDGWGRYLFDVCEEVPKVNKKRMSPAFRVVLMSGHGRNLTPSEANCTTTFAIKSLKNEHYVNDTLELTLLKHNSNCSSWDKESKCVGVFLNTYFVNYTPSYELYSLSKSMGLRTWNYTTGPWSVFCTGQFDLPEFFLNQVQKDLEQVADCEEREETKVVIIFCAILGVPFFGALTFYGLNRLLEDKEKDLYLLENRTFNYGSVGR